MNAPDIPTNETTWAVGDLEPVILDLRATVGIFGHLITANSSSSNTVDDDAWRKVEDDLETLTKRIEELWRAAWDQRVAMENAHEAALAAAEAKAQDAKDAAAAPLTAAELKELKILQRMLRGVATVITSTLDGKPVGLIHAMPREDEEAQAAAG